MRFTWIFILFSTSLFGQEMMMSDIFDGVVDPWPSGYIHCSTPTVINDVASPTGAVWMDRNLGASRVATASNDLQAYGDLFQWGRFAEGHQCRSSSTTSTNATTASPSLGNSWDGKFITEPAEPFEWLTTTNDNLWQGVNGINNPCPNGYRLPTYAELNQEVISFSTDDIYGAYNSNLKLPANGIKLAPDGSISNAGVVGYYYTSSVYGTSISAYFGMGTNFATMYTDRARRAFGMGVRCIKDKEITHDGFTYKEVGSPTGRIWLDRNLGATQVATSSTDANAYGDLYQWGRYSEGHQLRNSLTTTTNATTEVPNAGNVWDGLFITEGTSPFDWLSPQNDDLWQGVNGINNPCPLGFRIPTASEWQAEDNTFSPNNSAGAYASPLKLTVAGARNASAGSLVNAGSRGYYWSTSIDDIRALILRLDSGSDFYDYGRANGLSVRCIKETFQPTNVPNLLVWLDAQDVDGNFDGNLGDPSDGSDVTTWADKSGNGNNALTNSAAQSPHMDIDGINSLQAVQFDGNHNPSEADHFYFANLDHAASNYTFFAVWKGQQTNDAYGQYLFDMNSTSRFIITVIDNATNYENAIGYYTNSNGWNRYDNVDLNPHAFTWLMSSSGVDIRKDGNSMSLQTGTGSYTQTSWSDASNQIRLGANAASASNYSSIYGWLSEFLIYDRELTPAEISSVENYLIQKWGL